MITYFQLLQQTDVDPDDLECLLCEVFGIGKVTLLSSLHDPVLNDSAKGQFLEGVLRLRKQEPLAYILKKTDFYGQSYDIEPGILIPRPATECLIEQCLHWLDDEEASELLVLEFGYGSGVISLELARRYPHYDYYAWDVNPLAYHVARKNAVRFGLEMVMFYHGDFFDSEAQWGPLLSKAKHILFVANPPYISSDVFPTLESSVKDYEPLSALDGGESGLIYYERLLTILKNYSCVGFFEHGYDQREGLMQLGRQLDLEMSFYSDLQGLDRILKISH